MPPSTNVPWSLWTRSPVYLRNQGPLQEITVNQGYSLEKPIFTSLTNFPPKKWVIKPQKGI